MKPILYRFEKKTTVESDSHKATVRFISEKESILVRETNGTILEIGIGCARSDVTQRMLLLMCRKVIRTARKYCIDTLFFDFTEFVFKKTGLRNAELAEQIAVNFEMAKFEFIEYKTQPDEGRNFIKEVFVSGTVSKELQSGFLRGRIIGSEVNKCRTLANTPGGEMTPKLLAVSAKKAVRGLPIKTTILGEREIKKIGMGGILGVSRGSDEEPQFIILEYSGGRKNDQPVVMVGKGVTFDTGGLNLKPTEAIYEMHMDMSGGAAVIHAMALAARLGIKRNVVGLIPAVENMPSGSSYHPGDILKSLSGRTIEVLNTDAEGRIILADGITYAKRYKPQLVVDVATLTGAAMVALGQQCSAVFSTDEHLERKLRELGEESGDYVWPLPLWDEYDDDIKGTFGDIANAGKTRYGGAITAAKFLHAFAKDLVCPWVHIDIAPRMTSIEGEYLAKGAAGAPVRLLLKIIERVW